MRPRRWILALLLAAAILGFGGALAWVGLDLGGRLRDDFVRRLSESGLDEASIAAVHPAWIGVDLDRLGFSAGDGRFRVEVGLARLRVSPLRWLKNLGEPLAALDLVELRSPELVWRRGPERDGGDGDWRPSGAAWRSLREQLGLLPEIRLRDGRIRAALDAESEPRVLVDRLQGLVLLLGGQVELILRSQVLDGDHRGFEAGLKLDAETMDGRFTLALDSLRVGSDLLPELAGRAEGELLSSFRLDGTLLGGGLDSLAGGGWLRVDGLRLAGFDEPIGVDLELAADRQGLELTAGELAWRGQSVALEGSSDFELRDPRLRARGRELDLAEFAAGLGLEDSLGGRLDLDAAIDRGADGRWRLEGRLSGTGLRRGAEPLGRFETGVAGGFDELRFAAWSWERPGWARVEGSGRWRPEGAGAGLRLQATTNLEPSRLPGLGPHLKPGLRLGLELDVDWPRRRSGRGFGALTARLQGRLDDADGAGLAVAGSGRFDRPAEGGWPQLDVGLFDGAGAPLGRLSVTQGRERRWALDAPEAGALGRFLLARAGWMPEGSLSLRLDGLADRVEAAAELARPGLDARLEGELLLAGDEADLGATLSVRGRRGAELQGDLQLEIDPREIRLTGLDLAGQLQASGVVDLVGRRYRLDLTADDLALQTFWDLAVEDPAPLDPGSLSLDLAGEGPLDSLGLRGGVEVRLRAGARQLRLRGDLEFDARRAALGRGLLSVDGRDIADLELEGDLDGGSGRGRVDVRDGDLAGWLPDLVAGEQPLLAGRVGGGGELEWTGSGGLRGDLRLHVDRPRLAGRSFERFDLALSRSRGEPGLLLDSLVLDRGGGHPLRLEGSGRLPLARADEFDLELSLAGDLLQPLSVRASGAPSTFFRLAEGPGRLELVIGGTRIDPQLREGSLRISGGRMDLESVFRQIRDLEVDLEVENGRVDFRRFEARLGRDRLRLTSLRPENLPEELGLEPWLFETGELDLGVIAIETLDRRGRPGPVDVNVPGLMERDWDARIEVGGRGRGLPCLLAGPVERPRLTGTARVSNTRFTYPFIDSGREPTALLQATIDFLNSIEWDLALLPGRNVNYYRKVQGFEDSAVFDRLQGYLDRITVDLWIDPSADPLVFGGQIEEGSFRLQGEVGSRRGSVLYLDKDFEVEDAGMVFDASSLLPVVWGRAVHYAVESGSELDNPLFTRSGSAIYIQLVTRDELGNRQLRGRWNEIGVMLVDDLQGSQDVLQRGQEELLVEMGLNPYEPGTAFEEVLPGVVAGLWEIPLQPVESRLRRELGLDMVRIFVPVVRNTVEELLWTQTRQGRVSQSYLNYLQGSRVVLGKSVGKRTFASWTGQLMSTTAVESSGEVRLFQRWNLEYEVSRGLTLTGELVFDPLRDLGVVRGDPRLILRYRIDY